MNYLYFPENKLIKHPFMLKKYSLTLLLSLAVLGSVFGQTCNAPTALNVSSVTSTSAVLSWNSNDGVLFDVLLLPGDAPEPGQSAEPSYIASTIPFVVTGLTPCSQYKFYVQTQCEPTVFSTRVGPFYFSTLTDQSCSYAVTIAATADIPTSGLFAQVSGGSPPFMYQWSYNGTVIPGATNAGISVNGQFGQYQVTVTDSNNQVVTATYTASGLDIFALPNTITIYPGSAITTSTESVLANDFLMGLPVYPSSVSEVILTPLTVPTGFSINPNGTISTLPGTAPGTYTLTYQICAVQSPTSCAVGTATVNVANEGFLLNAFIDTNANGIQDSGEAPFNFGQFQYEVNNNGTSNTISSSNGIYYIQESNTANSYDFSFTINSNYNSYHTVSPSSYNDIHFVSGSGVMVYNFPVTQLPYADLAMSIVPSGAPPRPGFTYVNQINYKNIGTQAITSGTVTFSKDNAVTITSISQAGTTANATGFTYDFVNLQPNETRSILVTMQVPTIPTVALGNTLTNSLSSSIANDVYTPNNSASLTQIIVGSYDPNDKTESHGDKILHSSFTGNDYLTYTIQFENTGTYQAENVKINDILDIQLDETSVRMIDASHPYTLLQTGNNLNWNLNGIELLPSGKGHITFQVKPKPGYAVGNIIPNTAFIYFDFNPAIVTNTFTTEFVNTMGITDFNDAALTVYPNPTTSIVNIISKENHTIDTLTISDVSGKTVQTKTVNTTSAVVDLSKLETGIYFIKINSGNNIKFLKIIKQ